MEKIKITSEQEDAVKAMEKVYRSKEKALKDFIAYTEEHTLKDFSLPEVSLLLCGWYEVEEEFKLDDWVKGHNAEGVGFVGQIITCLSENRFSIKVYDFGFGGDVTIRADSHNLRKLSEGEIAKEKERRKWGEIGREVDEYKIGDIFKVGSLFNEVTNLGDSGLVYDGLEPFPKSEITLVTPVEQRFDKEES